MIDPTEAARSVTVVGLGNPLLRDDAVGLLAARAVAEQIAGLPVEVSESSWGGIRFLDLLTGFRYAVIIDAIQWGHGPPGTVYRLTAAEAVPTVRATGYHDMSLGGALDFGRAMGLPLPEEVVFFAVEAEDIATFDETPTPAVAAAVSVVVRRVLAELERWGVLDPSWCLTYGGESGPCATESGSLP